MKRIREMSGYLIVITLAFYVLPAFINDTGIGIFFLLILTPLHIIKCFFNKFNTF